VIPDISYFNLPDLPALLCIRFSLYLNGSYFGRAISKSTGLIITTFSQLLDAWDGFIKRSFILQLLKGGCHGDNFYGEIGDSAHIRHTGVPKLITGWQFGFQKIHSVKILRHSV